MHFPAAQEAITRTPGLPLSDATHPPQPNPFTMCGAWSMEHGAGVTLAKSAG
jgi:hypothetical protein